MGTKPPSFINSTSFSQLVSRRALLMWIREFLDKTGMSGCYLEFGVFQGESIKEAFYCLRNLVRCYIGFDSFQGLPEPEGIDSEGHKIMPQFEAGNYKSLGLNFVKNNIMSSGLRPEKLQLFEGFFESTLTPQLRSSLNTQGNGLASVIHIDVDLHSSTLEALNFSYSFMQTGTWLLFDDYWCYRGASRYGTQKAIADFLSNHSNIKFQEYCSYQGWSKSFVVECTNNS